jgi:hypothetical protein
MATDLVGLFFDPSKPDVSLETVWLVCRRCLHGRLAWHLRAYVSRWNYEILDGDNAAYACELAQRIKKYWPQAQEGSHPSRHKWKRAPALTHLGPSARYEIQRRFMRLYQFLSREISDGEAAECRLDHTNPPGFECLRNDY